jgi:hypothetical protein
MRVSSRVTKKKQGKIDCRRIVSLHHVSVPNGNFLIPLPHGNFLSPSFVKEKKIRRVVA